MAQKTRLCEICMKPIEADRLESHRESRLCSEHAEKIKKHGGEFIRSVSQVRSSKPGSIKINFGGIETDTVRNHAAIELLKDEYEAEKWKTPPTT